MAELVAVKITLSALSLFASTVSGAISAYKAYKLSAAFGDDWGVAERRLFIQYVKLTTLCKCQNTWFTNDLVNEQDPLTRAIKWQLVEVESQFKKCSDLMKKYHDIEEKAVKTQINNISKPIEPAAAPGTDKVEKGKFWKRILSKDKKDKSKRKKKSKSKDLTTEQTLEMTSVSSVSTAVDPVQQSEQQNTGEVILMPEIDIGALPEHAIVGKLLDETSHQAAARQDALGLYNRVRWVDHDREALLNAIAKIEHANTQLDDLLRLRSPKNPNIPFGRESASPNIGPAMGRVSQVQEALKRLHDALSRSVPSSLQDNDVYIQPPTFSIQISEQPESLADDLAEQLPQHDSNLLKAAATGSSWLAWTVQAHGFKALKDKKTSVLLYALAGLQPLPGQPGNSSEGETPMLDLYQEYMNNLIPESENLYRICRTIGSPADAQHLVVHQGGLWRRAESLRDILCAEAAARDKSQQRENADQATARDSNTPSDASPPALSSDQPGNHPSSDTVSLPPTASEPQSAPALSLSKRLQLARLIVLAFLHTALVCRATERNPRPENIFFYRPVSVEEETQEENTPDDPDDPTLLPILSPYLTIDLGRTNKHTRGKAPLGTTSGLSKKVVNPVAELGLVLFQIGASMTLDYYYGGGGGGSDVGRAVRQARLRMHDLAVRCGPDFAEAVALCLDRKGLYDPVGEEDYAFMENLRGSLWESDTAHVS
ncbi:hypothetical protein QBC47DRAFT_459450 [Echria macrotheca]|uniref:Prion-inhibition and propagation HeLo domain-containing protein n=1 Tax=Echria macrotheca TaxID=438768 RepID=A0AAJ0BEC6_9PEZI|nr:hypothetical protein QBC47DRAFT_459450 [Echria macrotheca]